MPKKSLRHGVYRLRADMGVSALPAVGARNSEMGIRKEKTKPEANEDFPSSAFADYGSTGGKAEGFSVIRYRLSERLRLGAMGSSSC
jgi:hypothetical protein